MRNEALGYDAFSHDQLEEGRELKIKHSVYRDSRNVDITSYVGMFQSEVAAMRQASIDKERAIFEKLCAAVSEWEVQAAQTQLLDRALQYLRTPEAQHTANQWRENRYGTGAEISNRVYRMSHSIREDTQYNRDTRQQVPVAWYVSWDVVLNKRDYRVQIAGQDRKRYTDKAAAEKYLQGRIRAYAHLFTEISPPIPLEHVQHFKVNGVLLPGYTIEGQEPQRTGKAAAEVSEGGILPKEQKPSVLGQLAGAKTQERAAPAAVHGKERGLEI